jgi:hypothetical protein
MLSPAPLGPKLRTEDSLIGNPPVGNGVASRLCPIAMLMAPHAETNSPNRPVDWVSE